MSGTAEVGTNGTNGHAAVDDEDDLGSLVGDDRTAGAASFTIKAGLAQMLKGGVIMDVVTAEQAQVAEQAGACAVMALERVPADIRKQGGRPTCGGRCGG